MKKVFLSLAAIAFVAAGSLTVTSCGGDDSTTPPPAASAGKLSVDGTDYALDTTDALVYTQKNAAGENVISLFKVPLAPGDTIVASRWIVQSYGGEDVQTAENLQLLEFYSQQDLNSENVTLPNQAEELYILGGGVLVGGTEVELGDANVEMNFNVFNWDDVSTINYETTIAGSKTAKLSFNGPMGVYATAAQGGKSLGFSMKNNAVKMPINTLKVSKQNMQIAN